MSTLTFGEIDWNSGDVGGSDSASDFLRLDEGQTIIRVMGNPSQFYVNWITLPDGKKRKVISPVSSPKLMQKLADNDYKRQTRWMVKVLNRTSENADEHEFKLLEVGSQIYKGIQNLFQQKAWGKVTMYDVVITRGPEGQQPLYTVTPNPPIAVLDGSYKERFVKFNDRIDIDKFIQPSTVEEVCELMHWDPSQFTAKDEETETETTESGSESGGDEDFEFDFE